MNDMDKRQRPKLKWVKVREEREGDGFGGCETERDYELFIDGVNTGLKLHTDSCGGECTGDMYYGREDLYDEYDVLTGKTAPQVVKAATENIVEMLCTEYESTREAIESRRIALEKMEGYVHDLSKLIRTIRGDDDASEETTQS